MGPDGDLQDPERWKLIAELVSLIRVPMLDGAHVPAVFWSCVWYSDLDSLRVIIQKFKDDPFVALVHYKTPLNDSAFSSTWKSTRSGASTPASGPGSPTLAKTVPTSTPTTSTQRSLRGESGRSISGSGSPARKRQKLDPLRLDTSPKKQPRSQEAVENCRKRDKKCVITKATEPCNASHIVPFSLGTKPPFVREAFWRALACFWPQEQVTTWRQYIETKSTETPENLLLLSPQTHLYFDRQLFALEPVDVSDDRKTLRVRFYWLQPANLTALYPTTTSGGSDLLEAPSMPADCPQGGIQSGYATEANLQLFDCEEYSRIKSGDIITLTTDDPDKLPLPNIEILRLHWLLHRVTALSAAAEPDEDDEYWDDPEEEQVGIESEEEAIDDSRS